MAIPPVGLALRPVANQIIMIRGRRYLIELKQLGVVAPIANLNGITNSTERLIERFAPDVLQKIDTLTPNDQFSVDFDGNRHVTQIVIQRNPNAQQPAAQIPREVIGVDALFAQTITQPEAQQLQEAVFDAVTSAPPPAQQQQQAAPPRNPIPGVDLTRCIEPTAGAGNCGPDALAKQMTRLSIPIPNDTLGANKPDLIRQVVRDYLTTGNDRVEPLINGYCQARLNQNEEGMMTITLMHQALEQLGTPEAAALLSAASNVTIDQPAQIRAIGALVEAYKQHICSNNTSIDDAFLQVFSLALQKDTANRDIQIAIVRPNQNLLQDGYFIYEIYPYPQTKNLDPGRTLFLQFNGTLQGGGNHYQSLNPQQGITPAVFKEKLNDLCLKHSEHIINGIFSQASSENEAAPEQKNQQLAARLDDLKQTNHTAYTALLLNHYYLLTEAEKTSIDAVNNTPQKSNRGKVTAVKQWLAANRNSITDFFSKPDFKEHAELWIRNSSILNSINSAANRIAALADGDPKTAQIAALREQFDALPEVIKNQVYYNIWEKAPDTWAGKAHADFGRTHCSFCLDRRENGAVATDNQSLVYFADAVKTTCEVVRLQ